MANTIFSNDDLECVQMSNGLTSVFISTLCLAGSDIAKTEADKKMMIWLAQRDQSLCGLGVVGFDVRAMPWDQENFEAQKMFMLEMVDVALSKSNWSKLDYEPLEDWVLDRLQKFRNLVFVLKIEELLSVTQPIWDFDDAVKIFEKCQVHGVYLHAHGCVVCND